MPTAEHIYKKGDSVKISWAMVDVTNSTIEHDLIYNKQRVVHTHRNPCLHLNTEVFN